LTVEIVPEANTEKVNVAMASGDFPDVVTGAYGTSATQQWIDDGMVIPLNDYFETMPNIKTWLEDEYQWSAIDGNYYGLPFITQYNAANALIIFRQDWLDYLG
ncbi:extracellular solute-binding protein, partial [Hungatella sp. SL.1.14]